MLLGRSLAGDGHGTNEDGSYHDGIAARVLAVARWLVGRGIACECLEAVGYGEGRPIANDGIAGGFARSRRVGLWVASVGGESRVTPAPTPWSRPIPAIQRPIPTTPGFPGE